MKIFRIHRSFGGHTSTIFNSFRAFQDSSRFSFDAVAFCLKTYKRTFAGTSGPDQRGQGHVGNPEIIEMRGLRVFSYKSYKFKLKRNNGTELLSIPFP